MSIPLTKPLVVPEYTNALVKLYVSHPVTSATLHLAAYTIDVQAVVTRLIPGRTARANACALNGEDLFIANSSADSQCVFAVPKYLQRGGLAMDETFVFTLQGNDYVGVAFDSSGNLYAAEGDPWDNSVVRYTGTGVGYPGAAAAAGDNFATRADLGNAGAPSYFANLAFDAAGNLWVSDYLNHRLVVFDAAGLGGANTYHVLPNLDSPIPVANTDPALSGHTDHLFAGPEGIDFDAGGSLWVANNNDGGGGVQNLRTSVVRIPLALQAAVLGTAPGGQLGADKIGQGNVDFFVHQVPGLADDMGAPPQFGGLQIDRAAGRLFVNEEVAGRGRGYDIATAASIGTSTAPNDLDIVSTNPGNGGLALVRGQVVVFMA